MGMHPPMRRVEQLAPYEGLLKTIVGGPDAALVEAMSQAAHAEWRGIIGYPERWQACDINDRDAIRIGMFRALEAARSFAARRAK
ncbi:MAG: hypothetical protein JWP35_3516 [Caulobacter sp.]|nr:hypothetical protein [Caulobacter sp.]